MFAKADKLLAAKRRISLRTLIPLLMKNGSNREVGPGLRDWEASRGHRPALEVRTLLVPPQASLAKAAGETRTVAQVEAVARLTRDRENILRLENPL